jgi:hypothetical protein
MARSTGVAAITVVFFGAVLLGACSSAPTESDGKTSEAVVVCPDIVGAPCTGSGPHLPLVCTDDPTSWIYPTTWADVPFGFGVNAGLEPAMIAAGCETPFWHANCTGFGNECLAWPATFCPSHVNAIIDEYGSQFCDQSTGEEPRGWEFVTWDPTGFQPSGCLGPPCGKSSGTHG